MNTRLRRSHWAALAVLAAVTAAGVHAIGTHAQVSVTPPVNKCGPTIPQDGGAVCTNQARAGVTPLMVANAESFAECLGTQGVTPPVVLHDPISITFLYAPGVVPSSAALSYCHTFAVRVPIKPITPPQLAAQPAPTLPAGSAARAASSVSARSVQPAPLTVTTRATYSSERLS